MNSQMEISGLKGLRFLVLDAKHASLTSSQCDRDSHRTAAEAACRRRPSTEIREWSGAAGELEY